MDDRFAKKSLYVLTVRMMKFVVFLLTVVLYFVEVCGIPNLLSVYLENFDKNVTKVRTLAECAEKREEFAVLDFIGLVEQYDGYKAEEYTVRTVDGYLLKLHRVNGSPMSPQAVGKPVVFIAPGIITSSDFYVMFGPERSLVLHLADAGYDVWIGNFRGTDYSKRHVAYSTGSNSFLYWDFSLDDLALIDLPLFIDTVLGFTNKNKLTYIGYSMGTTTVFMLLSTKPQYNDVMNVVISIAPVVYFTPPFNSFLKACLKLIPTVMDFFYSRNIYEILPESRFNLIMGRNICKKGSGKSLCKFFFNTVSNKNDIDSDMLETIFDHFPAGTSFNIMIHYYQMMQSGELNHYNFGSEINKAIYHTDTPPDCDLSRVTSPQAIFYSKNDVFASERNVYLLKSRLKNVVLFEKVPKTFNHLDYFWHKNAKDIVFNRVLAVVRTYST